ncbi:uncharacterized protein LOC130636209 [Hydractinia symbiolongicarpus]|uniref:uncharacterized protein LOC130636209 n=1 Tax=Hydractinia symbiolongicarpus TaxID=13093 RepID=UPI00254B55AB|nr:uncharacterized protein LOC130636209 [Hydractinia symbiolongicarpus]
MENYICSHNDEEQRKVATMHNFELTVDSSKNFYQTLREASKILKEQKKVCLSGVGCDVTRTINVAEDLKSQFSLYQHNVAHFVEYTDKWIPKIKESGMDSLEVTRHVPAIKVLLSKAKVDNAVAFDQEDVLNHNMIKLLQKEARSLNQTRMSNRN